MVAGEAMMPSNAPTPELQRPLFYIPRAAPFWARILIGANLLVFVAMIAYGWFTLGDPDGTTNGVVLITFGMKVNDLVAAGQFWRLFTAMFLHIGVLHLLFNLYALYSFGPLVEGFFGHRRFLLIYLIGGLFGSLASYVLSDAASAGASGAIFALIGATTIFFLRYRDNFGEQGRTMLQNMITVIGINLIFGYINPGIDNWAHMGGLLGGALVAWGLLPRYQPPAVVQLGAQPMVKVQKLANELFWVGLALFLLLLGVYLRTQSLNTP